MLHDSPNELLLCSNCSQKLALMPLDFPKINILDRLDQCSIDQIYIAYQFDDVIQSVIHSIKYSKMPQLGVTAGKYTARNLRLNLEQIQERIFLPVPLHPARQKERGYNQSQFIAKGIVQAAGGILLRHGLFRGRNTVSQTNLNRDERQRNVESAFHVKNAGDISGKTILLVDDLITTGATINECAKVLKEFGAQRVIGIAVASPVIFQPNASTA